MTAAVPDPRFRDQLAEESRSDLQPYVLDAYQQAQRIIAAWTEEDWADYADLARRFAHALAEVEARVQAAANQRAAEELRQAAEEVAEGHQGALPDWNRRTLPAWLNDRAASLDATPDHGKA
jgi:Lon protease-like protein